jgi:beta-glucosidase
LSERLALSLSLVVATVLASVATSRPRGAASTHSDAPVQLNVGARRAPTLTQDGLRFKDLNKNGRLDRYEDWRAPGKHWPGDGPVREGQDPHNDYGRWQVYPGGRFDHHLVPFQAAFEAGTRGIMGGYAIPVGFDTVGINFSKVMIADRLRRKHRFAGLVVTDWLRNMPWGVEHLGEKERQRRTVDAGVDQVGGDNDGRFIVELVQDGKIPDSRLDESAVRVLRPMFEMGLFDDPYVDPARAQVVVASAPFVRAGAAAQRKSIVLLKNARHLLPLSGKPRLYVENVDKETAGRYGVVVDTPAEADVAIVKVDAPYAIRPDGASFFRVSHEGTLAYAGAENARDLEAIRRIGAAGRPTVVCMYLERPAVLSEFIAGVDAVLAHFNSDDGALLDVLFGRHRELGKLPFDLPRDVASVQRQKEDVPFDLQNPLFRFGFGLEYPAANETRMHPETSAVEGGRPREVGHLKRSD